MREPRLGLGAVQREPAGHSGAVCGPAMIAGRAPQPREHHITQVCRAGTPPPGVTAHLGAQVWAHEVYPPILARPAWSLHIAQRQLRQPH